MSDIGEVFGGPTIKAADLKGREHQVTIESVEAKKFNDGAKLVIRFVGHQKALICNKTNAKRIAVVHGPDFDTWRGQRIILYPDFTEFSGNTVPCVRVKAFVVAEPPPRPVAPTAPAQQTPAGGALGDQFGDEIPF